MPRRCAVSSRSTCPYLAPPTGRKIGSSSFWSACSLEAPDRPRLGLPSTSVASSDSRSRSSSTSRHLPVRLGQAGEVRPASASVPSRRARAPSAPWTTKPLVAPSGNGAEWRSYTPTIASRSPRWRAARLVEAASPGTTSFPASTTSMPRRSPHRQRRRSRGLDLDDTTLASRPVSSRRSERGRRDCRDGDDVGADEAGDAPRSARAGQPAPCRRTRPAGPARRRAAAGVARADDRDARPRQLESCPKARVIDTVLGHRTTTRSARSADTGSDSRLRPHILVRPDHKDPALAAIEGSAAPLPSSTIRSGPSSSAILVPARTFESDRPGEPPPQRRQPTVGSPVKAAVSRWSEAAWRPARRAPGGRTVG